MRYQNPPKAPKLRGRPNTCHMMFYSAPACLFEHFALVILFLKITEFGRNDRMVGGEGGQGRGEGGQGRGVAREASRAPMWTPRPTAATRHTVSDQDLLRQSFRNYQI